MKYRHHTLRDGVDAATLFSLALLGISFIAAGVVLIVRGVAAL